MFQPSPLISLVATGSIIQGVYLLKTSFTALLGSLLPYWTLRVQVFIFNYGGYNPLKPIIFNKIMEVFSTTTYLEINWKLIVRNRNPLHM